jgi:large subunit ribosomal protein L10
MVKQATHVSEAKKKTVKELVDLMNRKTILVASIKNLPCALYQQIKKKLKEKAEVKVAKKNLFSLAVEKSKKENLTQLLEFVDDSYAILFSDDDAFELSSFLSDNKTPSKAKPGQVANDDIVIEPGATDLVPGPDISALSAVGLQVKVEAGKLAIQKQKVLVKAGETVTPQIASILGKLGLTPFSCGLDPLVAYSEGKVYTSIKINKHEILEGVLNDYSRALAFAVSLNYPTKETIPFILGKAGLHEKAINSLIKNDVQEIKSEEKQE